MEENKQLMEEVKNHLQKMFEYNPKMGLNEITILGNTVSEADDDNTAAPEEAQEQAPEDAQEQAPEVAQQTGAEAQGNAEDNFDDVLANAGAEEDKTPEGLNPQEPAVSDADFEAADTMQAGDEVLDVTELTDKQEDMEQDIKKIGGKFEKVLNAIEHFENMIKSNDEKIENLKAEFEKRNPTQIEKLNMQTSHSYPFNITPEEYWKDKEKNSNYSTEPDNNGKGEEEYTITRQDVEGDNNWKAISDSFNDSNKFMYHQSLDKLLNF